MEFLSRWKYNVVGLEKALQGPSPSGNRSVALTFDDGIANFYTQALPILKCLQFPATVFVVTDWVGRRGYLTIEQMKELLDNRIMIGSHGCTHRYLPALPIKEIEAEVHRSKEALEQKLGHPIPFFCYPYGGFSKEIVEIVRKAGYLAALTTNRGFKDQSPQNHYAIWRIRMSPKTGAIQLWAKCSGYYNLFRAPRPCH